MSLPQPVVDWIREQGWGAAAAVEPVGGGCIHAARVVRPARGPAVFVKHNADVPPDLFAREADGLRALAAAAGPRVPKPLLVGESFLVLEHLPAAPEPPDAWESFGADLAALHSRTHSRFGFHHDNYLGATPQPNGWLADGYTFFAERRLIYQGQLARERGRLAADSVRAVERLAARLTELIPEQPASLLHGDLWGGNAIVGPAGQICLIDPAAHYGWAEAELAMTLLFGRFPEACYRAYEAARPPAPGWRDRVDLYNLYHLLNHLNLFGASYLGSVERILGRYA